MKRGFNTRVGLFVLINLIAKVYSCIGNQGGKLLKEFLTGI